MKVNAKMTELVPLTHKFAKHSCLRNVHNEGTRSTPLDRKRRFCSVSDYFVTIMKVDAKQAKLVPLTHKFTKRSYVGIFRNERTWSTPLDPKLMFLGISDRFVTSTKVDAKVAELEQLTHMFAKWSCVGISTTNAPDPLHWTQNSCLRAFQTIPLLHESWCKTSKAGAINTQVR
jgi:hypothetical protein